MDSLFILFILLFLCIPDSMADSAWNSPNSSLQPAIASNETSSEWVKITVVPLGVFLIGACIWGIIVDTTARWSRSSDARGGAVLEAAEMPSHRPVNDGSVEQDVEEGIGLSQISMEDNTAVVSNPIFARDGMVELELQSPPNNRETEVITTNIQRQPTTLEIE